MNTLIISLISIASIAYFSVGVIVLMAIAEFISGE
jgi:hypothetical protein